MSISSILNCWYLQNKRNLPWRNTVNPYEIWVSEIILQQTKVAKGESYYFRFLTEFPDIETLSNADEQSVLKVWQGLGYYSRARNMHIAAKDIMYRLNGIFPADFEKLKKIKGIGDYTAAAIGSFAFQLPNAVVDGNVYRVISRVYGISEPIDGTEGKKIISKIANDILNKTSPAIHNQSMMEFGALQCVPKSPNCAICPISTLCFAYTNNIVTELPVKAKKTKVTSRYFNYLMVTYIDNVYMHQRTKNDIWKGLYEFPMIETCDEAKPEELINHSKWKHYFGDISLKINNISTSYVHKLSHQTIFATFYQIECASQPFQAFLEIKGYNAEEMQELPISKLIDNYLTKINS